MLRFLNIMLAGLLLLSACDRTYSRYFSVDEPTDEDLNVRLSPDEIDYLKGNVKSVAMYNTENECGDWWYYDTDGRCVWSIHRGLGNIYSRSLYTYDTLRRRIKEECYVANADNPTVMDTFVTTYTYSANGRRCKGFINSTDPNAKESTFRFRLNRRGQVTAYIYPDGSRISYRYDKQGHLVKTIWLDGREEKHTPTDLGVERFYDFDSLGNWISYHDDEHGVTTIREIGYY